MRNKGISKQLLCIVKGSLLLEASIADWFKWLNYGFTKQYEGCEFKSRHEMGDWGGGMARLQS